MQKPITRTEGSDSLKEKSGQGEPIDISMLPVPPRISEPDSSYGNTDRSAMIGEKLTEVSNDTLIKRISIKESSDRILVNVQLKSYTNPYDLVKQIGNLTSSIDFYYGLTDDKQGRNISLKVDDGTGRLITDAEFSNKDYTFIYYNVLEVQGNNTSAMTPVQTWKPNRKMMMLLTMLTPTTSPLISGGGWNPPWPMSTPTLPLPTYYSPPYKPTYFPSISQANLSSDSVSKNSTMKPLSKNLYPELPMKKVPKTQYGNTSRSSMIAEKLTIENGGKMGVHINENPDSTILVDLHFKYYDIDRILSSSADTIYYINWVYRMIGLGNSDFMLKIYGPKDKQIASARFSGSKNAFEEFYMIPAEGIPVKGIPAKGTEQTPRQGDVSGNPIAGNNTAALNNTQNVVINYW